MPAASAASREIRNVRSKGSVTRDCAAHDAPPDRRVPPRGRARRRGCAPRDGTHDRRHAAPGDGQDLFAGQIARGGRVRGSVRRRPRARNCGLAGPRKPARSCRRSPTGRPVEIAWTPDGTRVAFLIDGSEMAIYDAQTAKPAGTVRLLTTEAALTRARTGYHVFGERPGGDVRRLPAHAFGLPRGSGRECRSEASSGLGAQELSS